MKNFFEGKYTIEQCKYFFTRLEAVLLEHPQITYSPNFIFKTQKGWNWMFDPQNLEMKIQNLDYRLPSSTPKKETTTDDPNNQSHFEDRVNGLVKEQEEYGIAIKVFICDECKSGTSYSAEKVKRQEGLWRCNVCKESNTASQNDFFIYNKIESVSVFLMKQSHVWERVRHLNKQTQSNYSEKGVNTIKEFDSTVLDQDKNLAEVCTLSNAPFTIYCCSKDIPIIDWKTKKIIRSDEKIHEQPTINVILFLEEIKSVTPGSDSCYLLSLELAGFTEEEKEYLQLTHSLMCIPRISDPSAKFQIR